MDFTVVHDATVERTWLSTKAEEQQVIDPCAPLSSAEVADFIHERVQYNELTLLDLHDQPVAIRGVEIYTLESDGE